MHKIGWFSTGRGQGSLNLLNAMVGAIREGTVPTRIAFVFCSREPGDAEGSDRYIRQVQDYGLNLVCLSSKRFQPELRKQGLRDPAALRQWRLEYDRHVMQRLGSPDVSISVLAGYMLVVGAEMCAAYDMVNLHPAAPDGPAGTWQEVIWQLIEQRAQESGNMMHMVIEELDKGPPITFVRFPIRGPEFDGLWHDLERKRRSRTLERIRKQEGENNPLFAKIRAEGVRRELPLVVHTIRSFAQGHICLRGNKIMAGGKPLQGPYCLTDAIEAQLAREGQDFN